MQYNISINQKAVIENECFNNLDLTDLALFDFIYHFFNCNLDCKVTFRYMDKEYVEIRYQLIEQEMPILKFGCRKTFITRMSKLVDAGLICRYENNSKENRSGYCRGENFSKMTFLVNEKDKIERVTEELQGCYSEVTGGVTEELHNHSNKDNIYNKEEKDKSFSKKDSKVKIKYDELFEQCWKEYGRKGNKSESFKRWKKLPDEDKYKILPHIRSYIQSKSDKTYQKDFERYISNRTFDTVVYKGNMIIFDPEQINNDGEYRPQLDGFNLVWNEKLKCYISMYDISMLFDGYNDNNRPSSAVVMKNGVRYKWNTENKKWEVQ